MPREDKIWYREVRAGRTLVARNAAEFAAYQMAVVPGTDMPSSGVYVPVMVGERYIGQVGMESFEREDAFDAAAVRLLETVASSLGTALENARLFDETQRLLKETERRSSELAVINSIQQGMARELNFQAIVDLVGDKLREMFSTGDIGINWRDEQTDLIHHLYTYEHGKRLSFPPSPYRPNSKLGQALVGGQSVVLGSQAAIADYGIKTTPGTDACLSVVFVPIHIAGELRASIQIESFEREDAFDEPAVHLLSTIAASMGVALQNARLFDATQRNARESSALSDVGRDLSSTLDLATVMDRIAAHAKDLLVAENSAIFLPEPGGNDFRAIVALGEIADELKATVIEPGQGIIGSLLQSGKPEFINDTAADSRAVQIAGTESRRDERLMVVPLLAGTAVQGAMAVWRTGGSPFEARELEFLVGLSLQATIALNNARLFDETRAALERQTATAEVLQVISSSMADAQPVFERILDSCQRLFGTDEMGICLARDGLIDFPAYRGHFTAMVKAEYPRPLAGSVSERVMRSGDVVHIPDASAGHMPGYVSKLVQSYANFSLASAPMLWQGQGIGTIDIARSPPRPFSDKELALLRTFADQAVIAIQNARLFNETNEALERQTATAAILKVISESPTDIQPVFRAIVDAALRLFDVAMAVVMRREGDGYRLMSLAKKGQPAGEPSAAVVPLDAEANFPSRVMLGKSMLHLPDWSAIELPPHEQRIYDEGGYRASLMLPIMRGNECIGTIGVVRETAGAFSDKEIALMQSFVDQAVIAIENVRLFNETKEALEQQTATAEILRVISGSVTDTQPVFDAIVHSCRRLFAGKAVALAMPRGEMIESVAYASDSDDHAGNILKPWPLDRGSGAGTCILESRLIAVADTAEAATQFPRMRQLAIALGYQSGLFVPLLREGRAIGCLTILRAATGTFDGQEVALAQTFADQAVIAIENVRLFQQTQEALARQTATSEVLQVISQSPTDVQPVFDIIAERAASLTAARFCLVTRLVEGGMVQLVSLHGVNEAGAAALREAWPQPLRSSTSIAARAMRNRDVVNVADLLALSDTEYAPAMKRACELAGFRSGLSVPMLRDRQVIGAITVNRAETGLVRRQGDRTAADLRSPGGGGDRERASVQRDQGVARTTEGIG